MKRYLTPEFEEVKYDVRDCLLASGDEGDSQNGDATDWGDDD